MAKLRIRPASARVNQPIESTGDEYTNAEPGAVATGPLRQWFSLIVFYVGNRLYHIGLSPEILLTSFFYPRTSG